MALSNIPLPMPSLPSSSEITLDTIPGIGKKIAQKLLDYYPTEIDALAAIKDGLIGCVPGFTFKQGLRYAQTYFELQEGFRLNDILKTPDIIEIYQDIQEIIQVHAKTEYSKQKLQFYYPLPSSKKHLIYERQQYFSRAMQFYHKYAFDLEKIEFSALLQNLDTFKEIQSRIRIKSRIFISDSPKIISQIRNLDFADSINIEQLSFDKDQEIAKILTQYVKNFDVVVYFGSSTQKLPDFPNLLTFSPHEITPEIILPEKVIQIFGCNKNLIQNLIKIVVAIKNTKETELLTTFLPQIQLQKLKNIKENASILDVSGEVRDGVDTKLDQFKVTTLSFNSIISEIEGKINKAIQEEIGDRSIEIQGKQILDLFRTDISVESIRNYIPTEVDDLIIDIIHKHIEELKKLLELGHENEDLFTHVIPDLLEFPFQFSDVGVEAIAKKVSARYATYKYQYIVKIAQQLAETHHYLLKLHQTLLEFEFFYAIGEFAAKYHLQIPHHLDHEQGFFGHEMQNLQLVAETFRLPKTDHLANPIPIQYSLGNLSFHTEPNQNTHLALLTGSNSGGKTICLLTTAQNLLLAQMGFPTSGNLHFSPFDEFYYFKKSSGQISAGAFETTLMHFVDLAQSHALKLILADELEAITEPNAAAKVLAGIFALVLENPQNFGIFVTHLAEMLLPELEPSIRSQLRVDGIEAKGLDDKLNLIVDRNPKYNYLANSTPELILTRLANSGSDQQKAFFSQVLEKFQNPTSLDMKKLASADLK